LGTSGSWVIPVVAPTLDAASRANVPNLDVHDRPDNDALPLGKRIFGRSTIAEYLARSLGNAIAHTTFADCCAHGMRVLPALK